MLSVVRGRWFPQDRVFALERQISVLVPRWDAFHALRRAGGGSSTFRRREAGYLLLVVQTLVKLGEVEVGCPENAQPR